MLAERALEQLIRAVKKHPRIEGVKNKDIQIFLKAFLDKVTIEDIRAFSTEAVSGLVSSAWDFIYQRQPGRHKVKVFNADKKSDDWLDGYTAIVLLNDDMPFLFDSVLGALTEGGLNTHLVLHPILTMRRDGKGHLIKLASDKAKGGDIYRESYIYILIDRLETKEKRRDLEAELSGIFDDVRTVVLDWPLMSERVRGVIAEFQNAPPPIPVDELGEAIQLLDWLSDNNFTFLGVRQYKFTGSAHDGQLEPVKGSGLGILRDPKVQVLRRGFELVAITPEVREFLMQPAPLIIAKANVRATVHRRVHMDYIGIKQFDITGMLTGELRVVGLFTSTAYTKNPSDIPLLRRKISEVMERSNVLPSSHSGKALLNVLENYPRDELFQIDVPTLTDFARGIHQLAERPRTRIFIRKDKFDRFVSILVYIPRDRFNTTVRENVGTLLADVFDGSVSAYYPSFPEGALVRVHFIIGRYEGQTPSPNVTKLEARVAELVRTWSDKLNAALHEAYDNGTAARLSSHYLNAFTAAYQEAYSVEDALVDITRLQALGDNDCPGVGFYRDENDDAATIRVKLYNCHAPIALSDRLPILERMGLKAINERSYYISKHDGETSASFWIHDILLKTAGDTNIQLKKVKNLLEEGFLAVWQGHAESDQYNSLIISQALSWRDVSIVRACAKYLRQTGITFGQIYMSATLVKHSGIAKRIVQLFYSRFELGDMTQTDRDRKQQVILRKIEHALRAVSSLDEDRIIRRFANLITAMWRTNYFQSAKGGGVRPALAFKINSKKVEDLPEPRPYAEIFVYAPDVEGVHLRGGKIARGGLRWSDRPEDFRTEVLGLAKAQQVKNAVIVPVGAKGGFVPKRLPLGKSRDDILQEAIRCYKIFITSLLDVSDNLKGSKVIPPKQVIRHDGDDPYLVVAADKGTATFSDIANGISQEHKFWLDDAFASGGSVGYDHKKMGITARGGWEAVKRHFREMDIDIQTTPFRVIGVGDMSGDVFGNGMLLSEKIKLVAAFDHRDIFIDPNPDPKASHTERARIFALPRSSWKDYSKKLISKGGGIFSRGEKSIKLTSQIKELTGLKANQTTPDDLINALLKSSADLLWFGGIGTYVRASDETNSDAGDRANDAIRIAASDLQVKVIGEGANLGITQRGRIEFAQLGGRINTDAVDNSAGVNSSDMEVNIKIALGAAETAGTITRPQRNKLLASMTDEVGKLVLRNNYQQTLSLTLAETRGGDELGFQARFMRDLEAKGQLNRSIEFLPDEVALKERRSAGKGLTRPELSVVMAYAKITLFDQLLDSSVPDVPYLEAELSRYFPTRLRQKYSDVISSHRLRREIISTMLANSMINRGGPTFVSRLVDDTGADIASIAAAYALARDSFSLVSLNSAVDALENVVASKTQIDVYLMLQTLLRQQTVWFLKNIDVVSNLEAQVARFKSGIDLLAGDFNKILPKPLLTIAANEIAALSKQKLPIDLAEKIARLRFLQRAPEIIVVGEQTKCSLVLSASIFFSIGQELQISRLVAEAGRIEPSDYFDRLALNRQIDNLHVAQRGLTADVLGIGGEDSLQVWQTRNEQVLHRTKSALSDMFASGEVTLAKMAVASGYVRDLLKN